MLLTCHASSTVSSLHRFSVPNLKHWGIYVMRMESAFRFPDRTQTHAKTMRSWHGDNDWKEFIATSNRLTNQTFWISWFMTYDLVWILRFLRFVINPKWKTVNDSTILQFPCVSARSRMHANKVRTLAVQDCGPKTLKQRRHVFPQEILELHDNSMISFGNLWRLQLHSLEFWHQERVETWDLKACRFALIWGTRHRKRSSCRSLRRILMISSTPFHWGSVQPSACGSGLAVQPGVSE